MDGENCLCWMLSCRNPGTAAAPVDLPQALLGGSINAPGWKFCSPLEVDCALVRRLTSILGAKEAEKTDDDNTSCLLPPSEEGWKPV